jgi:hypothetical protein
LVRYLGRIVLLALVVVVLAQTLATLPLASAGSPSYTLSGYVYPTCAFCQDWSGVQVDLVSQATGQIFTTTTTDGAFSFTSGSTSGALTPGYWGLWVPAQGNVSGLVGTAGTYCTSSRTCAVLPADQTAVFNFYTSANLTSTSPLSVTMYANVDTYPATVQGYVVSGGTVLPGAVVKLLDPNYAGLVLYNTTSNGTTGAYSIRSPPGSYVLQALNPNSGIPGTTNITVSGGVYHQNVTIQAYIVTGQMFKSHNVPVGTVGNATLFDPTTGYIYTVPVATTGRYTVGTYGHDFGAGAGTFDLFLSAEGYATVEHTFTTAGASTPVYFNTTMTKIAPGQRGLYNTTLDFSKFDNATGTGTLTVNSTASLGSSAVVSNFPNDTVGMLWSQLGLAYNHSASLPASALSGFYAFLNTSGPIFPAVQAGTTMNGTGFIGPTSSQNFTKAVSACTSGYCGPSTSGGIAISWSNSYTLNGTLFVNSSTYSVGFGFRHPVSSSDIYNYTVILPTGYVLKAGTAAPTNTRLVPLGPNGTWSSFTVESLWDPVPNAVANFTMISATKIVAIVNATVPTYFAFSDQNVLNDTNGNYTVEVGVGQNVTFSAINSIYPSGLNGSRFAWTFGDGGSSTVSTQTTYHIYTTATSGNTPLTGTLNITASNHFHDQTKFHVWVAQGPLTAGVLSNATTSQNRTVNSVSYVFVNWGTTLYFNASASKALVSSTTTAVPGVLAVASFTLAAKGFSAKANYSESAGAYFGSNYSYQFLGAGAYLTNGTVGGNLVPFKGWQYNLTLVVWSGTGQRSTAYLVILVNDTEAPVAAYTVLNSAGVPITGKSTLALSNLSAQIQLNAANSSDPHNGSITRYYWLIGQTGNGSFHKATNTTTVKPYPKFWLVAAVPTYWINLTVFDLNGNKGWVNNTLTIAQNTTTTPILAANNLTGPTKMTAGSSYSFWVNITVGGGSTRSYIAGTPGSVKFYNYTSAGVPNTSPFASGTISSLAFNKTVRAVISWTPPKTGNYQLYANATASNEYAGDYSSSTNVASQAITVNPNPTTQALEYIAIAVAVIAVILLIILYVRRRSGRGKTTKSSSSKSGLERGGKRSTDEDEEDEES